jgi:DNA-binding NarL/FixJ family response regulator
MIRILIADDHPLVGDGISTMIKDEQHLSICAVCKTGAETIAGEETYKPDIILLDISLPDMDGLQVCRQIRNNNKTVKLIALTSTNEAGIISQFLASGGNGYLLKNMERNELLEAVDEVLEGNIYLSKAANQKILEQFNSLKDASKPLPALTRREYEILKLLYEGLNGPQIAEKLFLSHYTIETHRKNLMQKLNVNSTQQLVKLAIEYKLI